MNEHPRAHSSTQKELTDAFSLPGLVQIIRRRKLLLAVSILVCTAGAVLYALQIPIRYEARTLLVMNTPPGMNAGTWTPGFTVNYQFGSIRETLQRRAVLEPVLLEMEDFEGATEVEDAFIDNLKNSIAIEVQGLSTFHFVYRNADPQKAADVVNRVAEAFVEQARNEDQGLAAAQVTFIQGEAEEAESEMLAREDELRAALADYGGPVSDSLDDYMTALSRTKAALDANSRDIANLEADRDQYRTEIADWERLASAAVSVPVQINTQLQALQQELQDLLARYTPVHPEVLRVQSEIAELTANARSSTPSSTSAPPTAPGTMQGGNPAAQSRLITLRGQLGNVESRLEYFYEQRSELVSQQAETQDMVDRISAAPDRGQELGRLVQAHDAARANYQTLLTRLNQARMVQRMQPADHPISFSVAEPARVPLYSIPRQRQRIVAIGFAIGIFLGLGLMLLAQQLDSTFGNINDLAAVTGLPVLAGIPAMPRRFLSRECKTPIPTLTDRRSVAAEQFRILAVRIRDKIDREYSHVVLVTSSGGAEGKTTTCTNVAVALSQIQDQGVLLLDADLQRPRVRQYLADAGAENLGTEDGLREVLKSPDSLSPEMFGKVGNLYFLAGNDPSGELADSLASPNARKLISRLRKKFKYILIDSPPVLPMADTHMLAEIADRVVFVARAESTRRETLLRALQSFDVQNVLGTVLNGIALRRTPYAPAYKHYEKHYLPSTPQKIKVVRPRSR
jgi:polysaccharide chain length determinant protein (PEP-CTERM system associated)